MRSRSLSIGAWLLVATVAVAAAAEPKRPTGEEGGLFSLFTRGGEQPAAEAEEEPAADAEDAATEPVAPAEETVAEPPAEEPAPAVERAAEEVEEPAQAEVEPAPPAAEEAAAPTAPEAPASAIEGEPEPPSVAAPAAPPIESPSPPASEGPAWPDAPDSGGTLAEQATAAPEPDETPAPSVAAIEEPAPAEAPENGGRLDGAYRTDAKDEPVTERESKPEIAAREVPSGGSVAPGAVALPETEIQGEIEKPDIFFLLPKARDQSDDQVIRARIRREITQPLVKEWLEEMMLLK